MNHSRFHMRIVTIIESDWRGDESHVTRFLSAGWPSPPSDSQTMGARANPLDVFQPPDHHLAAALAAPEDRRLLLLDRPAAARVFSDAVVGDAPRIPGGGAEPFRVVLPHGVGK